MTPEEKRQALAELLLRRGRGVPAFHPPSHGQRALWLLNRISPASSSHHIGFAFAIRGSANAAILRRAVDALVVRHESLRTVFELREGAPVQRIEPTAEADFQEIEVRHLSEAEITEKLGAEISAPFALERGPLLRARLFRRNGGGDILLLAVHHIVCDGWSLWILLDELRAHYLAEIGGVLAEPPALRHSYADFARWESAMLAGPRGQQLWERWQRELEGVPALLELPPPARRAEGAGPSLDLALDSGLARALSALAERTGATRFMILLAAFQVLLHRITGQDDFVVGSPFLGRPSDQHGVVGLFANILPLRAQLGEDISFERFLGEQVRARVVGAIENEALPFSVLVNRLGVPREPDRVPLVQVVFAYQKPQRTFGDWSAHFEMVSVAQREGYFDLVLELGDSGERISGTIKYRRDRIDDELAAALAEAYPIVLANVLRDPSRRVHAIPLVSGPARRVLLEQWGAGPDPGSESANVSDLFCAQAERTPGATALSCRGEVMSYRELRARVLGLAARLRGHGVRAEVRVGVFAERSFDLIVAILAVLEAGGAYVPIDPSYPAERIRFIAADAAPALVLAQAGRDWPADTPTLDLAWTEKSEDRLLPRPRPSQAAYVIYTSGSTGSPRGVTVEHGSLANLVRAQAEAFRAAVGTRVLQFASPSFDASVSEIFVSLCHGATLCLAPAAELLPGPPLTELLERERIDVVKMTPSALAAMPEASRHRLTSLKTVMSAGECCTQEVAARWRPGSAFINVYGPTEATVCAALGPWQPEDGTPTVGQPLAGVRLYVLDSRGGLLPIGVAGELYIGGVGVARGYWNRPEATAERFLPDPFAPESGGRMYRTGDRARWRVDGRLEVLGRLDRQLKVRGYRIEPAEVESVLLDHPAVAETVVGSVRGPEGALRLAAWYVLRPDCSASSSELRAHLSLKLPAWMLPALLITVPRLPRTPHGKIDLRALPTELPRTTADNSDERGSAIEAEILEVWSAVLGAPARREVAFFEQGGDSLLLVVVHERLQRKLGREIAIADLLRFPTVAELAAWLELRAPADDSAARAGRRQARQSGQAELQLARTAHRAQATIRRRDD